MTAPQLFFQGDLLEIPEFALVMLVGLDGSGKSRLAAQHFAPTEVISLATCLAQVADLDSDQIARREAMALMREIAAHRLRLHRLTVLDAPHLRAAERTPILALAKEFDVQILVLVLDTLSEAGGLPGEAMSRPAAEASEFEQQGLSLNQTLKRLPQEGFRQVVVLSDPQQRDSLQIRRVRLPVDQRQDAGPFDIIGDVHGCCDELETLLQELGYQSEAPLLYRPPVGRRALFVGDLVDRGPRNLDALNLARNMVQAGYALCLPGNHEARFRRYLQGKKVTLRHGIEKTIAEVEALTEPFQSQFKADALAFIESLVSHLVLDQGRLVVAHAGMKARFQGRDSGRIKSFALYGDTTGEIDDFGLPVRLNWAADYRGQAKVVYGHVPVMQAEWLNQTLDIDTGCVFGGKLTALRYPECELYSVPAARVYYDPSRPLS